MHLHVSPSSQEEPTAADRIKGVSWEYASSLSYMNPYQSRLLATINTAHEFSVSHAPHTFTHVHMSMHLSRSLSKHSNMSPSGFYVGDTVCLWAWDSAIFCPPPLFPDMPQTGWGICVAELNSLKGVLSARSLLSMPEKREQRESKNLRLNVLKKAL